MSTPGRLSVPDADPAQWPRVASDTDIVGVTTRCQASAVHTHPALPKPARSGCRRWGEEPPTEVSRRLAHLLPEGSHHVVEGYGHVVPPDVLTPVVAEHLRD